MSEKNSYSVASNLSHNNQSYTPGSTIELTAEEAGPLILNGTLMNTGKDLALQQAGTGVDVSNLSATIEALNKELTGARTTIDELEVALANAKETIRSLEDTNSGLQGTNAANDQLIEGLRAELRESIAKNLKKGK